MSSLLEVIVPTFANPYLFWIIEKKNLIIRAMFNRCLKTSFNQVINELNNYYRDEIIIVHVDDCWARAKIDHILDTNPGEETKFVCWLIDYGIMRLVDIIYQMPDWMKQYPRIAKQASLHNIINLKTEVRPTEDMEFSMVYQKTLSHVEGVRSIARNQIEAAQKLLFAVIDEDEYTLHGDIICIMANNEEISLIDCLIKNKAIVQDEKMFLELDKSRAYYKEQYFTSNRRWHKPLDKSEEIDRSEVIFNEEENKLFPQEYFQRIYGDRHF